MESHGYAAYVALIGTLIHDNHIGSRPFVTVKVFPPAFRCPHKVSQLGKVAVCGPLEHLIKQDSLSCTPLHPLKTSTVCKPLSPRLWETENATYLAII